MSYNNGLAMKINQFHYHLPEVLIAQRPAEPRDHSRLLVLDRHTGKIVHRHFYNIVDYLGANDVLVRNNSKVMPARLFGKKSTGGLVELLLIKGISSDSEGEVWEVLSKPSLKIGQRIFFSPGKLTADCIATEGYTRTVRFNQSRIDLIKSLDKIGKIPIPPYIHWSDEEEKLKTLYQTTYAKIVGSAAAPTAGLHFTPQLDQLLTEKGVKIEEVTLHVGLGTFLPVKSEEILEHHMHSEWCEISTDVAARLRQYKQERKRIVAVGTTSVRTLESMTNDTGEVQSGSIDTQIFIYPGYRFKCVDALITNFHLPESTLLMLISAFVSTPNTQHRFRDFQSSLVGKAYEQAIKEQYRFFSFGDAMLIE